MKVLIWLVTEELCAYLLAYILDNLYVWEVFKEITGLMTVLIGCLQPPYSKNYISIPAGLTPLQSLITSVHLYFNGRVVVSTCKSSCY